MAPESLLFENEKVENYLSGMKREILSFVDALSESQLANSPREITEVVISNFPIVPLSLQEPFFEPPAEVRIPDSSAETRYAPGYGVKVHVPFTGNPFYFKLTPASHILNPMKGEIVGQELIFYFQDATLQPQFVQTETKNRLAHIQSEINNLNGQLTAFVGSIESFVTKRVMERKENFKQMQSFSETLELKIQKRKDFAVEQIVPLRRKQLAAPSTPGTNEFVLETKSYEEVLSIIRNLSIAIERSPSTFSELKEEDIRNIILVLLNAVLEGQASGETFNGQGKTDILVRKNNGNVFIGECKFWKGAESLNSAVSQLLDYVTWRDAKTAIILFNRGTQFSKVLEQIIPIIEKHESYDGYAEQISSTEFRFRIRNKTDSTKKVMLAVLAFDVPILEK